VTRESRDKLVCQRVLEAQRVILKALQRIAEAMARTIDVATTSIGGNPVQPDVDIHRVPPKRTIRVPMTYRRAK
jgi:hypothetical protein